MATEFRHVFKLKALNKDLKNESKNEEEEELVAKTTEKSDAKIFINKLQLDNFIYRSMSCIENLDLQAENMTRSKSFEQMK